MTLISFPFVVDGSLTDAESVVLSDPTEEFGLRSVASGEVIVADGTALNNVATGTYELEVDLVEGVQYEYWIEAVYEGSTFHVQRWSQGVDDLSLRFVLIEDGSAVAPDDGPRLSNPTGTFGVRRMDNDEVVVSDGVSMSSSGTLYSHTLMQPAVDLDYRWYVELTHGGTLYHLPRTTAYMKSAALVLGRYTNSHLIEQRFGVENVHKWLGIDDSDEAVDWALRFYAFIAEAEQELDDLLRGSQATVPYKSGAPRILVEIATMLAGVRVYESRGVIDIDVEEPDHRLRFHQKQAEKMIARIKAGEMRLEDDKLTRHPQFVD